MPSVRSEKPSEKLNKLQGENVVNVAQKKRQLGETRLERYQRSTLGVYVAQNDRGHFELLEPIKYQKKQW